MNCLCCGKLIRENSSDTEKISGWHKRCVKNFFNTNELPLLDISEEQLTHLVNTTVNKGMTIPGVQKKLSLHLSQKDTARFTIVDYPTGYILKPQAEEYPSLPEFEDLAMKLAEIAKIKTVPHALMKMNDQYVYITKRIDRNISSDHVHMYAMEDFCQLSNRLTFDKYRGSYENIGKLIKKYSSRPGLDLSELFIRVVFSYIIGNSDMHLKNFSLIETSPSNRIFSLSSAYDFLPVNIIMPEDTEEMALTLNGKKRNLNKKDFLLFAERLEISKPAAEKIIKKLCSYKNTYLEQCNQSYLSDDLKIKLKVLIEQRIRVLEA